MNAFFVYAKGFQEKKSVGTVSSKLGFSVFCSRIWLMMYGKSKQHFSSDSTSFTALVQRSNHSCSLNELRGTKKRKKSQNLFQKEF
jgi:hypothetical protein